MYPLQPIQPKAQPAACSLRNHHPIQNTTPFAPIVGPRSPENAIRNKTKTHHLLPQHQKSRPFPLFSLLLQLSPLRITTAYQVRHLVDTPSPLQDAIGFDRDEKIDRNEGNQLSLLSASHFLLPSPSSLEAGGIYTIITATNILMHPLRCCAFLLGNTSPRGCLSIILEGADRPSFLSNHPSLSNWSWQSWEILQIAIAPNGFKMTSSARQSLNSFLHSWLIVLSNAIVVYEGQAQNVSDQEDTARIGWYN